MKLFLISLFQASMLLQSPIIEKFEPCSTPFCNNGTVQTIRFEFNNSDDIEEKVIFSNDHINRMKQKIQSDTNNVYQEFINENFVNKVDIPVIIMDNNNNSRETGIVKDGIMYVYRDYTTSLDLFSSSLIFLKFIGEVTNNDIQLSSLKPSNGLERIYKGHPHPPSNIEGFNFTDKRLNKIETGEKLRCMTCQMCLFLFIPNDRYLTYCFVSQN